MYSRFMNDPLDEEYLVSPGIVGSYADGEIPAEEIEVREAVIRFKVTGDQVLSMNLFHRLFHYRRYRALLQIVGGDKLIIPFC